MFYSSQPICRIGIGSLALLAIASVHATSDPLGPGMRAPELKVGKWLKGQPVRKIEKGVYVVEFWATWCVPCKASMPHLSALAKKNPNVTVVGVSIKETDATLEDIQRYVDQMGDKMAYNVAVDQKNFMSKNWMLAAKQNSIPAAFLIKDGIIQWIGEPLDLDTPLAQVLSGAFDIEASKKKFYAEAAEFDRRALMMKKMDEMSNLIKARDGKKVLPIVDKLIAENPQDARFLAQFRIAALMLTDPAQARIHIDKAIEEKDNWRVAGAAAMLDHRNEAAEYGAEKLISNGAAAKDPMVCFLIASYYISTKNKTMALMVLDLGDKAVAGMDEPDMKKNLARLRKNAEALK